MGWQVTPYSIPIGIATVILVGVMVPVFRNRDQRTARPLLSFLLGTAVWCFGDLVRLSTPTLAEKIRWFSVQFFGIALATASFFLLTATFTDRRRWLTPTRLVSLAIAEASVVLVVWTNPFHGLYRTHVLVETGSYTLLGGAFGPFFFVHIGFHYLLLTVASYWLLSEYREARTGGNELYTRQVGLMVLAMAFPWAASLPFVFGLVPVDLTPFGFAASGLIVATAVFRYQLLDIVPIARGTVVEQLDNGVVVLDSDDRVVDVNEHARELLGPDRDIVGAAFEDAFAAVPSMAERFADVSETSEEVTVQQNGTTSHYEVRASPITDSLGTTMGRTLVFNDITEQVEREHRLREREGELDLMRQVFSRVLRHNLRNDLQVVRMKDELLAADLAGTQRERAEAAVSVVDELVSLSNKARMVERLVDGDQTPREVDLADLLAGIVETYRREFPAVSFSVQQDGACVVETLPSMALVFENLVENAAQHNTTAQPTVEVRLTRVRDSVRVTVSDNGPGIPRQELAVIEQAEETDLEHGSGLGLWVVDWVIANSAASISYDTGPSGTTVTVQLPTADETHRATAPTV